jgi:hypothetical protein
VVVFAMSAFVTLLLVVDPVGLVPAFLSATHGLTEQDRTTIAIRAPQIAAGLLVRELATPPARHWHRCLPDCGWTITLRGLLSNDLR